MLWGPTTYLHNTVILTEENQETAVHFGCMTKNSTLKSSQSKEGSGTLFFLNAVGIHPSFECLFGTEKVTSPTRSAVESIVIALGNLLISPVISQSLGPIFVPVNMVLYIIQINILQLCTLVDKQHFKDLWLKTTDLKFPMIHPALKVESSHRPLFIYLSIALSSLNLYSSFLKYLWSSNTISLF